MPRSRRRALLKVRRTKFVEGVKHVNVERVYGCTVEHVMEKPISQILEMGEVNQLMTRNRISDRIDEQVDVAVPENRERNVEVAKWVSQEQVQNRDVGRIVGTKVQRFFNGVGEWMVLEAQFEQSAEYGNVKGDHGVSHEREFGVSESGSEGKERIELRVGERRRETMAGGDGGRSKRDEDRRIYAKQRVKIWRVAVDEQKRLVKEEDGDVYAVHGGRIVTARMVDQLR